MPREAAVRTAALIRVNTVLLLRDPGALISRMILPLAFLVLLHPLYEAAQGRSGGIAQAVIATLVTFSLLALSIVGGAILTDRMGHTWERVRATAARPAEALAGKALPILAALLAQQVLIIGFGVLVLGLRVTAVPLLGLALLAWTLTLLGLGALIGVLARSLSELSASYDIGAMILLFITIAPGTPVWLIAVEAFFFGLFSSLQYVCMNTLAFADLQDADESNGSTIASTVQQMSMSFGVAVASLATIVVLGGNRHPGAAGMVWGIHRTFVAMGLFTMATAWVFKGLRPDDGASVSRLR